MTPRDRLDTALVHLADQGRRPPCGEWRGTPSPWLSEDPTDRDRAAALCTPCPLLDLCAAAADEADEAHHVWGGTDRTRKGRKGGPSARP